MPYFFPWHTYEPCLRWYWCPFKISLRQGALTYLFGYHILSRLFETWPTYNVAVIDHPKSTPQTSIRHLLQHRSDRHICCAFKLFVPVFSMLRAPILSPFPRPICTAQTMSEPAMCQKQPKTSAAWRHSSITPPHPWLKMVPATCLMRTKLPQSSSTPRNDTRTHYPKLSQRPWFWQQMAKQVFELVV